MVVRADAFYANDTDALPANWLASRLRRKPLFFDAHEMFPEVPELVGRQRVKRFWTWIEHRLFPTLTKKGSAAVTVCQSIADIYAQRYGLHMEVVRNVPMAFPVQSDSARKLMAEVGEGRRILLYQGAVNIGRGIEWIVQAMPLLPECVLVVAGVGDIYDELRAKAATMDNVRFLGRVSPEVLHGLTGWASLGLSLLENRGLNYYYSLPNRIADFVQAGVPVLATDFPEIRRVVEQYGIGTLVAPVPFDPKTYTSAIPDPAQTAQTIRDALAYWDSLPDEERKARFTRAAADLNWNNDKKKLLMQFDTIF
jgi:glycosyltransferase involved in cell wall biosynthesis